MKSLCAAACAGLAAWCSLGTLGLSSSGSTISRLALLPPWWLLPAFIVAAIAIVRAARLSPAQLSPLFGTGVTILPWLPLPLPSAALLWTGPFALAVWIAAIAGVMAAREPRRNGSWLTDARRAPLAAAAVAAALYGLSAWWLAPVFPDGDAPHYLILAQSLVTDGDIRIENNHRRGDYLEYTLGAQQPHYLRRGLNGEIYSIHAPGLPAVIAPAYFLSGYAGTVAFLGLVAAAGTGLVWWFAYRSTGDPAAAWFGWASSALTTPFFFQATQVFPDGVAATCVLVGTSPLIAARFAGQARSPANSKARFPVDRQSLLWLASGVALAVLPWLQTRLALVAAATALCVCAHMRRASQFLTFAAVPFVSAVAWFAFFNVIYGTLNPAAPYGTYTQTAAANLVRGGPGLIFDQQFGLVPNAPVYGFILAGVMASAARLRRWSWEWLIVLVPYLAGVGLFQIWWGGTSSPARLVAPLSLVLGVAAAWIWHDARNPGTKATALAALVTSVLITAVLAIPGRGSLVLNFRDGVALWLEWGNDLLDVPRAFPSLFRDSPGVAWVKAAVWSGSLGAAWLLTRAIAPKAAAGSRPALGWPAIWCLAAAVMIALTTAWRVDGADPLTPETANLALLRGAAPFRSVAFDYGTRSFERSVDALSRIRLRTDRGRRPAPPTALLSISNVPAGAYLVHVTSTIPAAGALTLRVGDTQLPFWTAALSESQSIAAPVRFAVDVDSVVIDGDEEARRALTGVDLEPRDLERIRSPRFPGSIRRARRAAPYGAAHVYFMDDLAYPEPSGFWVAGGRSAQVVVAQPGARFQMFLRNAPVKNMATIDVDGERRDVLLDPGQETAISFDRRDPARPASIRFTVASGFRPSQLDPSNQDLRYLGCWVEFR